MNILFIELFYKSSHSQLYICVWDWRSAREYFRKVDMQINKMQVYTFNFLTQMICYKNSVISEAL